MEWMEKRLQMKDISAFENINKNQKKLVIGDLEARIPVIQGGMGVGISLSNLAGHVAKAGGIGVISSAQIGFREETWDTSPLEANLFALRKEIIRAKEIACGGIIGVNIMVATKCYEQYVTCAVEAGADLIISGAGLPVDLPKYVEHSNVKIAPIVSSVKSLEVLTKYWMKKYERVPDLIIVEGPLAGGHLGFKKEDLDDIDSLHYENEIGHILEKVASIEREAQKEIPVVIAGGIYSAKDMKYYLDLGASGVQVATRFVTTYECDADEKYKLSYINAKKEDIEIVKSPVGMPGRAIHNKFLDEVYRGERKISKCHQCLAKCNPKEIPYCITDALVNAAKGNVDEALLFCGANAYLSTKLEHVEDIMKEFDLCRL